MTKNCLWISNLIIHFKEEIIDNLISQINPLFSNILRKISKLMNYEILAKNIYTTVKLNGYGVMKYLDPVSIPGMVSKSEHIN